MLFLSLALCQRLFTSFDVKYAAVYVLFSLASLTSIKRLKNESMATGLLFLALLSAVPGILLVPADGWQPANNRDLLRDAGVIFSFVLGFKLIADVVGDDLERGIAKIFSRVGVVVSIWTIAKAGQAFSAGETAYIWRGEYIPFVSIWLPFCGISNYYLYRTTRSRRKKYYVGGLLCISGIAVSLSRTDIALYSAFLVWLVFQQRMRALRQVGTLVPLAIGIVAILWAMPHVLSIEAVQQRIGAGIGAGDQSMGWRNMEDDTLFIAMNKGGTLRWLFGFGLGIRMPLPIGIFDFNGNSSIPILHNSFLTILLKFGLIGLVIVVGCMASLVIRAYRDPAFDREAFVFSVWSLLFCLGHAVTLQGMTEWTQTIIFGIVMALFCRGGRKSVRGAVHGMSPEVALSQRSMAHAAARWRAAVR